MTTAPDSAAPAAPSDSSLAYRDNVNRNLLRSLPKDARTVVELGCFRGALGEAYKRLNPHCTYTGIEIDPASAAIAQTRLDRVVTGNAEDPDFDPGIPPGTVDCLIYGDVLEHFIDPWQTLAKHRQWLKPDGVVVACIPNIQHWSVISNLIRGHWAYADEGLLDRTHLRFFTREGVEELFTKAELELTSFCPVDQLRNDGFEEFKTLIAPLLERLRVPMKTFDAQTAAYQYIVQARIPQPQPVRHLYLQSLVMEAKACKRVRVQEPHYFMEGIPGFRTFSSDRETRLGLDYPEEQTVFLWQRPILLHSDEDLNKIRQVIRQGYLFVVEVDDDPLRWKDKGDILFTYRAAHAVQTSTERLAGFLRQLNPNVAVFPNQVGDLLPPRVYEPDAPVRLFFGALNRKADWMPLISVLNQVLQRWGDRVHVEVIFDQDFFDALETPHKTFQPFVPYGTYKETLQRCDLAILPLEPNRFNSLKSDLKFLECAAAGVTVLASPVIYEESIQDGITGLIYRNPTEFETRLNALIDRPQLRQSLAQQAYEWVKANRVQTLHFRDRYDWYCSLLDRLPELNASLRRRVPEVFQP